MAHRTAHDPHRSDDRDGTMTRFHVGESRCYGPAVADNDAVSFTILGDSPGDLRQLQGFLTADSDLRGRIELVQEPPEEGQMGILSDLLRIAGGSSAVLTTAISGLFAWIRSNRNDVEFTVTGPAGVVHVSARRIRSLSLSEISNEV